MTSRRWAAPDAYDQAGRTPQIAPLGVAVGPYSSAPPASGATLALNSGECYLRLDISDLLGVGDQQATNRRLRQCPISAE